MDFLYIYKYIHRCGSKDRLRYDEKLGSCNNTLLLKWNHSVLLQAAPSSVLPLWGLRYLFNA